MMTLLTTFITIIVSFAGGFVMGMAFAECEQRCDCDYDDPACSASDCLGYCSDRQGRDYVCCECNDQGGYCPCPCHED